MKDLFKQNKLFINKKCVNTIAELESYCYIDSKDSPTESENPIKENDHMMDAIRYPIFMEHLVQRKIMQDRPRPVFEDSRYGGKISTTISTDDDITEAELAKM